LASRYPTPRIVSSRDASPLELLADGVDDDVDDVRSDVGVVAPDVREQIAPGDGLARSFAKIVEHFERQPRQIDPGAVDDETYIATSLSAPYFCTP
jgi:hypothetical protein